MAKELTRTTRADRIRALAKRGYTAPQIAAKLAPNNARKRRTIKQQVQRVIQRDEQLVASRIDTGNGAIVDLWPDMVEAQIKRALRGRTDAMKFLAELSGIHNPKVQHEHSGDVNLRFIAMPRPDAPTSDQTQPQLEAPVVEGTAEDL